VWGGVGRGKTWLMDLFFQSLPFRDKQRSHFHRFMQSVHDELKKYPEQTNPLDRVADRLAQKRACCASTSCSSPTSPMRCCSATVSRLVRARRHAGRDLERAARRSLQGRSAACALRAGDPRCSRSTPRSCTWTAAPTTVCDCSKRAHTWFDAREAATRSDLEKLFDAIAASPGATTPR
jgi:hypothetical protein